MNKVKFAKYSKLILFVLSSIIISGIIIFFPYEIYSKDVVSISEDNFDSYFKSNIFYHTSKYVSAKPTDDDIEELIVEYKLFNLINIKSLKVNVTSQPKEYLVGGNCIGFDIKSKGAIVVGGNFVITANGLVNPIKNSSLQIGDIITQINEKKVETIFDIINYLNALNNSSPITLTILRNNKNYEIDITPALDIQSNKYKLGLWLKDNIVGLGTLTFFNNTNSYGALGHPINTETSVNGFEVESGNIYNCSVLGVKEAGNNQAGQLLGTFSLSQMPQGNIIKNNTFGVFGKLDNNNTLTRDNKKIEIGGKKYVKPGKAQIMCTVSGNKIETFDIEIIKTNYQAGKNDKNMVIRVIDKKLLNLTGGIVQGMSGSPIIQDGKLIGAVTHVFLNDASKGFALYIDNMIDELIV